MDRVTLSTPVKILILIFSFILAIAIAVGGLFYFFIAQNIASSLTLEVGETYRTEDFLIRDVPFRITGMTSDSPINWSQPGEYSVYLEYLGVQHRSKLILVDTTAPDVTLRDVTALATQEITLEDFIISCEDSTHVQAAFVNPPDMTLEGTQPVQLKFTDLGGNITTLTANLTLTFDKQAPTITGCKDQTVYVGKPIDIQQGITVQDDLDEAPKLTVDLGGLDMGTAGTYTVTYTATDASGNVATQSITVTVIHDTQAPQIFGVNKLSIYQGSTVSYRKGIVITDDHDQFPRLSIDSSRVNMEVPGTYEVIYTATDAAGNTTSVSTTITIQEKLETYVDEAIILAEADKIIAEIITDGMTLREQVEAVYDHVTTSYRYTRTSDKTDRLQAAYHLMTGNAGDCFNYYAVTSLLLERLNIPQISVERSPESVRPTRHYWSLVSIDGGETYYHVDTCPMYPLYAKVCLVTDEVLEYVNQYIPGYFTMEPGKYPETPKEPLPEKENEV